LYRGTYGDSGVAKVVLKFIIIYLLYFSLYLYFISQSGKVTRYTNGLGAECGTNYTGKIGVFFSTTLETPSLS
jgi:hypothetical protein